MCSPFISSLFFSEAALSTRKALPFSSYPFKFLIALRAVSWSLYSQKPYPLGFPVSRSNTSLKTNKKVINNLYLQNVPLVVFTARRLVGPRKQLKQILVVQIERNIVKNPNWLEAKNCSLLFVSVMHSRSTGMPLGWQFLIQNEKLFSLLNSRGFPYGKGNLIRFSFL